MNLTRRQLLFASALGLSATFLPSLGRRGRIARADPTTIPRIVIFTSEHQIMPEVWKMLRGNPDAAAFEYALGNVPNAELSDVFAPLAGYKDRTLAIDGLSLASGIPNGPYQGHALSATNLLTAAGYLGGDRKWEVQGPSVDQLIAEEIADPDRIPSLELATHRNRYVASGLDERPPAESKPKALVERLFPPDATADPSRRELIGLQGTSVLDLTARQYESLVPRLAGEDREKLDRHRQMIRDLERRVVELRSLTCEEPTPEGEWAGGGTSKAVKVKQFGAVIGAAFACDMTRVATVQVHQLANEEFDAPPGDVHQDYAHQAKDSESAAAEMRKYNIAYAKMFADLVDQIGQYSDVSGNLLDNTLVVWLSEHGLTRKAHTAEEHGAIVVGNVNGYFRTGRYLSLPRETPNPRPNKETPLAVPHSHFLVSLMQAVGMSANSIGRTEFEDADGGKVSLTGPIEQLT